MKIEKNAQLLAKIGGCVAALVCLTGVEAANALSFQGDFAPANWALTNNDADGSVDLSNTPDFITLTGGDDGSSLPGTTDYTITASNNETIDFDWSYSSIDGAEFDFFARLLNGLPTTLADTDGQSGTDSFSVNTGDIFGFRIATTDNLFGSGIVNVGQNLPTTAVLFEFSPSLGLLLVGSLLASNHLYRKQKAGKLVINSEQ